MTIVRPVTQRVPHTVRVMEESSLPFAVVVTPYAGAPSLIMERCPPLDVVVPGPPTLPESAAAAAAPEEVRAEEGGRAKAPREDEASTLAGRSGASRLRSGGDDGGGGRRRNVTKSRKSSSEDNSDKGGGGEGGGYDPSRSGSGGETGEGHGGRPLPIDTAVVASSKVVPAGSVARCGKCGATPSPCSPVIDDRDHEPFLSPSASRYEDGEGGMEMMPHFLCGLCGAVTGLDLTSQYRHHLCNVSSRERRLYADRYVSALRGGDHDGGPDGEVGGGGGGTRGWGSRRGRRRRSAAHRLASSLPEWETGCTEMALPVCPPMHPNNALRWYLPPNLDDEGGEGGDVDYYEERGRPPNRTGRNGLRGDGGQPLHGQPSPAPAPAPAVLHAVDARHVPPVLIAIVDAGVGTATADTLAASCESLHRALRTAPPFALFGMCLIAGDVLSVFDLSSPIPHLRHVRLPDPTGEVGGGGGDDDNDEGGGQQPPRPAVVPLADVVHLDEFLSPAGGPARSRIEAAMRAVGDARRRILPPPSSRGHRRRETPLERRRPLVGGAIEAILDLIEDGGGVHPGLLGRGDLDVRDVDVAALRDGDRGNGGAGSEAFPYAGGKIMVFLSGPPDEVPDPIARRMTSGGGGDFGDGLNYPREIGTGGFGGSCAAVGKRFPRRRRSSSSTEPPTQSPPSGSTSTDGPAGSSGVGGAVAGPTPEQEENWAWSMAGDVRHGGLRAADRFNALGERAALLALGVELFGLSDLPGGSASAAGAGDGDRDDDVDDVEAGGGGGGGVRGGGSDDGRPAARPADDSSPSSRRPFFGFPLLRFVSDRSGGCGPLVFDVGGFREGTTTKTTEEEGDKEEAGADGGTVPALVKEVLARCPWYRPCAFGCLLRIRTSPSFGVDTTSGTANPIKPKRKSPDRHYRSGGMWGIGLADPAEPDLWHIGACDVDSTVSFDLEFSPSSGGVIADRARTGPGGDEVDLPPCIQTAFAYTAIVPCALEAGSATATAKLVYRYPCDDNGAGANDRAGTDVDARPRRMDERSDSVRWMTVRRLRVLTSAMEVARDTESLTQSLDAEALAVVLFRKLVVSSLRVGLAEAQMMGREWLLNTLLAAYRSAALYESPNQQRRYGTRDMRDERFFPRERLIGRGGELSDRDVLLAQGHDRLCALPLLVFTLLQCDVLRPSGGYSFRPSVDSRCAACANMGLLKPSDVARLIAPRLELWSNEQSKSPCAESVNLSREAVRLAIEHEDELLKVGEGKSTKTKGGKAFSPFHILLLDSPRQIVFYCCDKNGNKRTAVFGRSNIGEELRSAGFDAARSYRVPPPIHYVKESADDAHILDDSLVEDSGLDGMANFDEWCTEVADLLYDEVTSR